LKIILPWDREIKMKELEKITLILGGARSGKSRFALTLGEQVSGRKAFVATAEVSDAEMAERIQRHREARPKTWKTMEEPVFICDLLSAEMKRYQLFLIDCLTLWLSNLMRKDGSESAILTEVVRLVNFLKTAKASVILVSNEVGSGIVSENPLTRRFRDLAGLMNQQVAEVADAVYLVSAGIPLKIK